MSAPPFPCPHSAHRQHTHLGAPPSWRRELQGAAARGRVLARGVAVAIAAGGGAGGGRVGGGGRACKGRACTGTQRRCGDGTARCGGATSVARVCVSAREVGCARKRRGAGGRGASTALRAAGARASHAAAALQPHARPPACAQNTAFTWNASSRFCACLRTSTWVGGLGAGGCLWQGWEARPTSAEQGGAPSPPPPPTHPHPAPPNPPAPKLTGRAPAPPAPAARGA